MEEQETLRGIFAYYAARPDRASQENIVAMLREVQEVLGCVPESAQRAAAGAAGVKPSFIAAIVKRYPSLKPAPWRPCVTLCTGPRCAGQGAAALLAAARRQLSADKSGLSADGRVLLRTQNCLKQCRAAPNVLVDGALHSRMTPEKLAALLDALD